jgi:hypothetical protein
LSIHTPSHTGPRTQADDRRSPDSPATLIVCGQTAIFVAPRK